MHAKKPEWAQKVTDRIKAAFPQKQIYKARLSSATGVHGGPKAMAIAFIEGKNN